MFWFFGSSILIYCILPIMHRFFSDTKKLIVTCAIFMAICLGIDLFNFYNIHINGASHFVQENIIQTFRMWSWMFYFMAGGLLCRWKLSLKISTKRLLIFTILASGIAVAYMYYMMNCATKIVNGEYLYDSLPVMAYSICVFFSIMKIRVRSPRAIQCIALLASVLIPVYAVHVRIIKILIKLCDFRGYFAELLCFVIVGFVAIAIGYAATKIPVIKKMTKL